MSDILAATLQIKLDALFTALLTDAAPIVDNFNWTLKSVLTDGVASGQADKLWHSLNRALIDTGTEDLDLYNFAGIDLGQGSGKGPLGQTITLVNVTTILIYNRPTSVGSLQVGNKAASTGLSTLFCGADAEAAGVIVKPGGLFLLHAPLTSAYVVSSSVHLLHMLASGGAVAYDAIVLGRSA